MSASTQTTQQENLQGSVIDFPVIQPEARSKSDNLSPFGWWRTREPGSFGLHDLRALRKALLATTIIDEHDWYRAITGDALSAIGIAIRQLHCNPITAPDVDLSVSAALCVAIEGNAAAKVLVSSALRRRSKIDPACQPLINMWLTARRI